MSAVFAPASCSFSIPMIGSSEKREGFIRRLLRGGLYPNLEEVQGLRSPAGTDRQHPACRGGENYYAALENVKIAA